MKHLVIHYKIKKGLFWQYKVIHYRGEMVSIDTIQVKILNEHGIRNPKRIVIYSTTIMSGSEAKKYLSNLDKDPDIKE